MTPGSWRLYKGQAQSLAEVTSQAVSGVLRNEWGRGMARPGSGLPLRPRLLLGGSPFEWWQTRHPGGLTSWLGNCMAALGL